MASAYWRTNHTVETLLNETEVNWEFLQLINVLLMVSEGRFCANDSEISNLISGKVNFKASLAEDFPPGEIRKINIPKNGEKIDVVLANGTLSTQDGPLPEPFVSWIKELSARGDDAMASFIDLFNHHVAVLRYLIALSTRPTLANSSAEQSEWGDFLQGLSGVFFNRDIENTDVLLSGMLANNRLSLPVVQQLLWFSEGLRLTEMNSYQGVWLDVDESDHTRLGSEKTAILGQTTALGKKIWDQHKGIELVFEDIHWQKAREIIPGGKGHNEFCHLMRRITDCRCDCHVVFMLPRKEVPGVTLKEGDIDLDSERMQLGTSSLLTSKNGYTSDMGVEIRFTVEANTCYDAVA